MVVIFGVLMCGWVPTSIVRIVRYYASIDIRVARPISMWGQVALVVCMIDLFLYNHGVRKYLIGLCRKE